MSDNLLDDLIAIGDACIRCGWKPSDVLWCTESNSITVAALLNLKKYRENVPIHGALEDRDVN